MGCLRRRRLFRKVNPIWSRAHQKWAVLTRIVANHYATLVLNGDYLCSFDARIFGTQLMLGMLKQALSDKKLCANLSFASRSITRPFQSELCTLCSACFFLRITAAMALEWKNIALTPTNWIWWNRTQPISCFLKMRPLVFFWILVFDHLHACKCE